MRRVATAVVTVFIGTVLSWLAEAPADEGARFRGLQFGADARSQLPECARRSTPIGGTSRSADTYAYSSDPTQTCWQRHPFCDGNPDVREKVNCEEPWLILFADSLAGTLPAALVIEQPSGKLARLSTGGAAGLEATVSAAEASVIRAESASEAAHQRFTAARYNGRGLSGRENELMALAKAADEAKRAALLARRTALAVKITYGLSRVSVEKFSDIEALFQAKYGRPALAKDEPWQSKGGANTVSHVRAWKWKGLFIQGLQEIVWVENGVHSSGNLLGPSV